MHVQHDFNSSRVNSSQASSPRASSPRASSWVRLKWQVGLRGLVQASALVLLSFLLGTVIAHPVRACTLTMDAFTYADGSSLNGQSGGNQGAGAVFTSDWATDLSTPTTSLHRLRLVVQDCAYCCASVPLMLQLLSHRALHASIRRDVNVAGRLVQMARNCVWDFSQVRTPNCALWIP